MEKLSRNQQLAKDIWQHKSQISEATISFDNVLSSTSLISSIHSPISVGSSMQFSSSDSKPQPIVLGDGTRMYLKRKKNLDEKNVYSGLSLLEHSMGDLLHEADNNEVLREFHKNSANPSDYSIHTSNSMSLWVDQYSPKSFTQV